MALRKPRVTAPGRVTMRDVAAAAQTSMISVSRAFRGSSLVSSALRARIEEVADQLGYVPDRAASALASARSMNVAVLIPSITNMVFADMLVGIDGVLTARGYQIITATTRYDPQEELRLLRGLLAFRPDGVLLTGKDHLPETKKLLDAAACANVTMMDLCDDPARYAVGLSQEKAGAAIAHHFIERGYQNLGFVAAQLDPRTIARGAGFKNALLAAGRPAPYMLMVPRPSSAALGGELLNQTLQSQPDIEALFFCNDDLALGALFECSRQGIKVPEQLALVGFNDLPISACAAPALTTIATPRQQIGRQAAAMLLELMAGRKPKTSQLDLGFTLNIRGTS